MPTASTGKKKVKKKSAAKKKAASKKASSPKASSKKAAPKKAAPQKKANGDAKAKKTPAIPIVGPDGKVDKKAVVEQYTNYVYSIAGKIKKSLAKNIEFDDLVAYGMTGLLEAADRYDPKFGANFMTFSYYRIRGAIYDGLRGMGWVSRSEYQKIRFEERATAYLENVANRNLGSTADHKSVEDNVEELAEQVSQLVTIYVTSLEGLEDMQFQDTKLQASDDRLADVEMKAHVRDALARLPEQDKKLLTLYYFKEMSLQEVGNELGLSKSWTSRRHAQAVDKLSRILQDLLKESAPNPTKKRSRSRGGGRGG
jgi:RNA polymerase sigma factor for flagellar operon FliA